jgi:hypothetical protein
MNVGFAIFAGHIHGDTILAFGHLKPSMAMHSGKKASSEQLNQFLVRFATPDKHSGAHTVSTGVSDRYAMSHVFGRETKSAGNASRSQVLQPDQANAHDGVPMLSIDLQRRRQKALYDVCVRPEVQKYAAGDHALDQRQHLSAILTTYSGVTVSCL